MHSIAEREYNYIRRLVYEHSHIHLGANKKELVVARVGKRLRHFRMNSFREYCALLDSPNGREEVRELVDVITTNHTSFFREISHFEFFTETVLPEWRLRLHDAHEKQFRLWSAGCSFGDEPYSLAMVLADFFSQERSWTWQVEASDISARALAKARQAVYEEERIKPVKPEWLRRHFQQGLGAWAGHYRIKPELQSRVRFHHFNLLHAHYPFEEGFHAIFCRNVMIYFDRATQEKLVAHLAAQLATHGYLFVGHSESLMGLKHYLKSVRPSVYVKTE
ncbi:MAG: protein-glutamate O-methyltransferase CheR [Verrucomicrobia bacterium]|nr:protein-glutamate O-methyltransferase CheR [Verrucomicrobiota bacterium]